jgi:hypothetical protein
LYLTTRPYVGHMHALLFCIHTSYFTTAPIHAYSIHCQHVILCHGGMPSEQNQVPKPGQDRGEVSLNGLANF